MITSCIFTLHQSQKLAPWLLRLLLLRSSLLLPHTRRRTARSKELLGPVSACNFLLLNLREELSQFLISGTVGILDVNGACPGTFQRMIQYAYCIIIRIRCIRGSFFIRHHNPNLLYSFPLFIICGNFLLPPSYLSTIPTSETFLCHKMKYA
jgi:hypothetical protein